MASIFISRVDTEVDARLDHLGTPEAAALKGSAAIANACLAYQAHEEMTGGERWPRLARLGARPQRPLWASTGVKDPAYPDTKYVAGLIAPGTVNTMPGPTMEAFADHGQVSGDTITGNYDDSRGLLDQLAAAGIDFDDVTGYLERDGLAKFEKSCRSAWSLARDMRSSRRTVSRRWSSPARARRTMKGFGVHTFRLVGADGASTPSAGPSSATTWSR